MEYIIKKIEQIRKEKEYSHEYMAHMLDISQAAYSKMVNNVTKLSVDRLFKIAEILDTSIGDILDIHPKNQFNQTTRDSSTGYLQKIENFYQENKEQYQKIIDLYEERLKDKDALIHQLESMIVQKNEID